MTAMKSDLVQPPCIEECRVQMEAELMDVHETIKDLPDRAGATVVLEVKILRVHADDSLRLPEHHRVDVDKWRPTIMRFQDLYNPAPKKVVPRSGEDQGRNPQGVDEE